MTPVLVSLPAQPEIHHATQRRPGSAAAKPERNGSHLDRARWSVGVPDLRRPETALSRRAGGGGHPQRHRAVLRRESGRRGALHRRRHHPAGRGAPLRRGDDLRRRLGQGGALPGGARRRRCRLIPSLGGEDAHEHRVVPDQAASRGGRVGVGEADCGAGCIAGRSGCGSRGPDGSAQTRTARGPCTRGGRGAGLRRPRRLLRLALQLPRKRIRSRPASARSARLASGLQRQLRRRPRPQRDRRAALPRAAPSRRRARRPSRRRSRRRFL